VDLAVRFLEDRTSPDFEGVRFHSSHLEPHVRRNMRSANLASLHRPGRAEAISWFTATVSAIHWDFI
jgi:hypothetical protein